MKLIDKVKKIKEQNPDMSKDKIIEKITVELNTPKILATVLYDLV